MKAERVKEATEEKSKASRRWLKETRVTMRIKERNYLHNIKILGKATSADVEAAASYPEDVANVVNEDGSTDNRLSA